MNEWKEAFWLTKLEFKQTKYNLLFHLGLITLSYFILVGMIANYFAEPTIGVDIFFLLAFSLLFRRMEPGFKSKYINSKEWATTHIVILNHLAVKKEVIVKHRFLSYLLFYLPLLSVLLYVIYVTSPTMQSEMSVNIFLIFSVIWLSFSIYIGSALIAYEARIKLTGYKILFAIILPVLFLTYLGLYFTISSYGLVNWAVYTANTQPILSLIISISLAILGFRFWKHKMLHIMKQTDYLR